MKFIYIISFVSLLFLPGCHSPGDKSSAINDILKLNDDHRNAHLEGDAELFVKQIDDSLTIIQDGEIYMSAHQEVYDRFSAYFKTVQYFKWDDLVPPEIVLSDDGSLATLTTKKIVIIQYLSDNNNSQIDTSQWAWLASYALKNNQWKMTAISSGVKPESPKISN